MKKNFLYIFYIFILLFICSGCSLRQTPEVSDWQDEVLIAEECGMDGLSCCAEDPKCKYGQTCCENPVDHANTYCADECVCGKLDKFCCGSDLSCEEGLVCLEGVCASCGQDGDACCANDKCSGDLLCAKGICRECGVLGGVCCIGDHPCANEDDVRLECSNDFCVACGMAGQKSCMDEPVCSAGGLLNNNECILCGKENNPCCNEEESGYECEDGLKCDLGFCN